MDNQKATKDYLCKLIGEEGCGVPCDPSDVFLDEEGWKLQLCGFMEPWKLGKTMDEVRTTLKEYTSMGFGLS